MRLPVAVLAFFARLLPTVYRALKFDDIVGLCAKQAAEFKNLQDRFRQCAKIFSLKPFAEFEAEFRSPDETARKGQTPELHASRMVLQSGAEEGQERRLRSGPSAVGAVTRRVSRRGW